MLAAMGGILALVFARWGVSIILSMLPAAGDSRKPGIQADARVLGFAAGVSLLSALLFGLAPAWRADTGRSHGRAEIEPGQRADEERQAPRPSRWWPARSDCRCFCWSAPDCSSRRYGTW